MNNREYRDQAEIAALIEADFDAIARGEKTVPGLTVVDDGEFYRGEGGEGGNHCKALTLRDSEGNYYVHFKGTGDGFWPENAVAYGPQDERTSSGVQDWSKDYFDYVYEKYIKNEDGKVYVSGHSQGANSAQYVTMNSDYADMIDDCISLDSPGFSKENVKEMRDRIGEEAFERRRSKIHVFNGENDYVSCTGEEFIYLDENVTFVKYVFEEEEDRVDFVQYHDSHGLISRGEDGKMHLNDFVDGPSSFRKLVREIFKKLSEHEPPEERADIAMLVMKLCENLPDDLIKVPFSDEELEKLKKYVVPMLVEVVAEDTDLLKETLLQFNVEPAYVDVIVRLIEEFDEFDEETRVEAVAALAKFLRLTPDGKLDFSLKTLVTTLIEVIVHDADELNTVFQTLCDAVAEHPEEWVHLLAQLILDHLPDRPVDAIVFASWLVGGLPYFIFKDLLDQPTIEKILDRIEKMKSRLEKVKSFLINTLENIKTALPKIAAWAKQTFGNGTRYANANPDILVDTGRLRAYALRIQNVNRRLKNLDRDLNSLYWQVGLLDLWQILMSNLITCESHSLTRVQAYLNDVADDFDDAERKAQRIMGG